MKLQQTWLDNAIVQMFPKWGLRRMQYKAAISSFSTYRGAEKNRLRSDWNPFGGSADSDLLHDLPTLRERSRQLDRDDVWARSVFNTLTMNTIGTGLRPQSRVLVNEVSANPDEVRAWQRACERIWREHMPLLDSQRRMEGYAKQRLLFRSVLQSGDVLDVPIRKRVEGRRTIGICTETIEGDRLATPINLTTEQRARIREGVELNADGMPIRYWVKKRHPGDVMLPTSGAVGQTNEFISYPARNSLGQPGVFHLYWMQRPGQTRGEPWLAPALSLFKDIGDTVEARVVAERIAACFAAFVTRNDPFTTLQNNTTAGQGGQRLQQFEPGMIWYGEQGEDVKFGQPNFPGGDFEQFIKIIVKAIGAGTGLPYELITKDFTDTTYTSARAALLEARRFFRCYQQWFASQYLQPLWEMIILEAWARGLLPNVDLLGPERSAWLQARWVAPAQGYVDPTKEVKANLEAISGHLTTYSDVIAEQGKDWEEVFEQEAREAELREELGLDEQPEETPDPLDPNNIETQITDHIEETIGAGNP